MDFEDLKKMYLGYKQQYGASAPDHISEILKHVKELHRQDWFRNPTKGGNHEQSWHAFKGKNLEKLIEYIITDEVENLGLKIINGNKLERSPNLPGGLSEVKRNLQVDFKEFGLHLPDVDMVIYDPVNFDVLAVISSKVTLRERIAQTGYWKFKLAQNEATRHIKVFFLTLDEDETLKHKHPVKKGRAIVETELDGSYVLTEGSIEESHKVKRFEDFIEDLKNIAGMERYNRDKANRAITDGLT